MVTLTLLSGRQCDFCNRQMAVRRYKDVYRSSFPTLKNGKNQNVNSEKVSYSRTALVCYKIRVCVCTLQNSRGDSHITDYVRGKGPEKLGVVLHTCNPSYK
jgi:hypothetical protein